MNIENLEKKSLISTKTNSVYDYQFVKTLENLPWRKWYQETRGIRCQEEFKETYFNWILSSKLNKIRDLGRFSKRHYINGTTQAFDEFYLRHSGRRLRIFRGEYAYHKRVIQEWTFIEDEPLIKNDFVIISIPFCTTGDIPTTLNSVLDDCLKLQVPVLIDCAYFGTCENIDLNLEHPAISEVCFSLSKGLGLGDFRVGIRFSNYEDNYPICQQNNYQHLVHASAKVGLYFMQKFTPDFIPEKYSLSQKEVCKEIGLIPTKCMHLGLGVDSPQWKKYEIDRLYYRVGIRELVKARFKGEI